MNISSNYDEIYEPLPEWAHESNQEKVAKNCRDGKHVPVCAGNEVWCQRCHCNLTAEDWRSFWKYKNKDEHPR